MVRLAPPLVALALALVASGPSAGADEPDPAALAFFESRVRPILVERCQSCHGAAKAKGGLRLDTGAGLRAGGEQGPAVVAGQPGESLLIDVIGYEGDLRMPPKSKLPDAEIATLRQWVEQGAAWLSGPGGEAAAGGPVRPFDLAERARHWSWQPVRPVDPPLVRAASWPINAVDRFVLARLEAAGLTPAPEASRATLIRRLSFDLIGLPPTSEEVAAFESDPSSTDEAYARLVERLLASPHYGERWARHWMDLVRFAETSGHEFDYEIPQAFRYRDYLIRAFNSDLPFDQFVVEQVAGDLVDRPRRDPTTGANESILGTGFFRLHEGTHSPVDLADDRTARVDNQIDTLGKSLLALTVSCARCHDHKFDAITTQDYYALSGFLTSSRHALAFPDAPEVDAPILAELADRRARIAAALELPPAAPVGEPAPSDDTVFARFEGATFAPWRTTGPAFGTGPTAPGAIRVAGGTVVPLPSGVAHSGAIADRLRGALRSPTFTLSQPRIHLLVRGQGGRVNVVVEGFEKIRDPIYGRLNVNVNHDAGWHWITMNVVQWVGLPAYIEVDDGATVDFNDNHGTIRPGDGTIALAEVRLGSGPPPAVPDRLRDAPLPADRLAAVAPLVAEYAQVAGRLHDATLAPALIDGTGLDARVQIRGNPRTLGAAVPRRFLEVLGGLRGAALVSPGATAGDLGSGRLALAHAIADPANPLTARVLVNRLWHHHFGRGIVGSVDDFGAMGQAPTHPELLDYLATEFVASGWSTKAIHRLIATSRAYRQSSAPTPEADRVDPGNLLVHRRNLGRLDAESIRDAILLVSGRLDPRVGGPSVAPHLTTFMEGRGRPGHSGPLDGAGRRTIYLNVRRNFLTPMLLAFDFPTPAAPMGRRNTSNVPAQALTLLNDPFILAQARTWADRTRSAHPEADADPTPALRSMYRAAFSRPPTPPEVAAATAFLQSSQSDSTPAPQAWADLAHALFNVKEFVAIP